MEREGVKWFKIITNNDRFPEDDVFICDMNGNKVVYYHEAFKKIPKKYTHFTPVKKPGPPKL